MCTDRNHQIDSEEIRTRDGTFRVEAGELTLTRQTD